MGLELYKSYDKTIDWLRMIASSSVRTKIFESLNDGEKDLSQLRDELDLGGPSILHAIKELEIGSLVKRTDYGDYALTNIGKVQAILLTDLIKTIAVLSEHKNFWLTHDISGIPEELLKETGALNGCKIIRSTPTDMFKPFADFVRVLNESKKVKAILPIFHEDFPEVIEELLKKQVSIRLITNDEILNKAMENNDNLFREVSERKNCGIWLNNDIGLIFTVTDKSVAIYLPTTDGRYDYFDELVGGAKESIVWGDSLFDYYLENSKKVKL